jgi:hypothetical protein
VSVGPVLDVRVAEVEEVAEVAVGVRGPVLSDMRTT